MKQVAITAKRKEDWFAFCWVWVQTWFVRSTLSLFIFFFFSLLGLISPLLQTFLSHSLRVGN